MHCLSEEEQKEYASNLDKVDWGLPGMDAFSERDIDYFKRSILAGDIVESMSCLGWALWPTENKGFYDTSSLRMIASFLEIQNKPFWDEYDKYCEESLSQPEDIDTISLDI